MLTLTYTKENILCLDPQEKPTWFEPNNSFVAHWIYGFFFDFVGGDGLVDGSF